MDKKSLRGSQKGDANIDQQQPLASKRSFVKIPPEGNTPGDGFQIDTAAVGEIVYGEEIKAPLSDRHIVAEERQSLKRANSQGSKF